MVSWALLNTFSIPIGLWVLRNGFAYYRSFRQTLHSQARHIQAPSPRLSRVLNALFLAALVCFISTLPYFQPPNVFLETKSRFQTPSDVIFSRLSTLRPLTDLDVALKPLLQSKESRLYYFKYGPHTITSCLFCRSSNGDDRLSYLIYALPSLLSPHIFHLIMYGAATSASMAGYSAARFRGPAIFAALTLMTSDLYLTYAYDGLANTRSTRLEEMEFFFWRMRVYRGLALAAADAVLGLVLWLAGTNRFFIQPPGVAQRLENAARAIEHMNIRLYSNGNIRNAVLRSPELRDRVDSYWAEEKEIFQEREVLDNMRHTIAHTDMRLLDQQAETAADHIVADLSTLNPAQSISKR